MSRRARLFSALVPIVVGACSGLRSADINVTLTPDPKPDVDGGTPSDDDDDDDDDIVEPKDAGTPPDDFSCEKSYWVLDAKPRAECESRRVRVVLDTPATSNNGVSIARTTTGRIGISFNFDPDAETSKLRVAHFKPTKPDFDPPAIVTRESPDFKHAGYMSRIVASAPDTFHVLSFDWEAASDIGAVVSQKLVNGAAPLTDPEVVVSDVEPETELGFAIDSAKTQYALVRLKVPNDKAKMLAFRKQEDGAWASLPDVPEMGYGLLPKLAPSVGASAMVVDPNDRLHILYHHNETTFASHPRYHVLASEDWSYRKTIDNNIPGGFCGFGPRLAIFGSRKYALYFFHKQLQDTPVPVAELRLATWVTEDDRPQVEIIDQAIPSTTVQSPRYRAALAVDKYGLLHMAVVRPSPSENQGYLEYRRQQRVVGGGTRWISDIVDDDVLSLEAQAEVDLLVDENARPHIAYVSGKDHKLRYATRYDR